jgi:uncharacterized membrane protein YeaQ/YmgE (transglycosylase-associated protein family)
MLGTIIGLLSGAAGGNIAGKLLGQFDQGTLINSISGIVGGGIGGTVLSSLGMGGGEGMDIAGIASQVVGGGIGGGGLLAIVGTVRNMMNK